MTRMGSTGARRARLFTVSAGVALLLIGLAPADAFKIAPPLSAPGLDGKPVQVKYADARVTLVNFWATWCLPCREEMPAINRTFQKYRDRGFRAVGLALQSGEPAEVKEFLEGRKIALSYPILMSSDDLAEQFGDIEIIPTTYLIGPKGEILKSYFGLSGDFEKILGAEIEKHVPGASAK